MKSTTSLSFREEEVMRWVCVGKTNWEIGTILNISVYTVKNHMKSILRKTNARNRTQAAQKVIAEGFLEHVNKAV